MLQLSTRAGIDVDRPSVEQVTNVVRSLGLQPAVVEGIEQAVRTALGKAVHLGDWGPPRVTIRIWISDRSATTHPLRPSSDTGESRPGRRGSWGFFLVERQEGDPGAKVIESHAVIELYLYREDSVATWAQR